MSSGGRKAELEEKFLQAARKGDLKTVRNFLEQDDFNSIVDINCKGKSKSNLGWSPLHLSSYFGHRDVVEILLKCAADVNIRNGVGDTPLHRAAFVGRSDIVTVLLKYNADTSIINGEGKTAIMVTDDKEVKALIQATEKSEQLKLEEELLNAARDADIAKLRQLLSSIDHPVNLNCVDILGNTALHCAAYRGHKEVAVMLLQNGADTSVKNKNGKTALELTRDPKLKQLLDVQPLMVSRLATVPYIKRLLNLNMLHLKTFKKTVQRFEGPLLKKSRLWGWRRYWVVLERGVLQFFNRRADAASGVKRQGFKYLDNCIFSVPREDKHKIKVRFSDNTVHIWSVFPDKLGEVDRQKWLNSLHEHCAYSTHYTTQPTLLYDDSEDDKVPLGSMRDAFKSSQAHQQLLEQEVANLTGLINNFTDPANTKQTSKASLTTIKHKMNQIVCAAGDMCSSLNHCLTLLSHQEEVRKLQLEEEVEKRRVLEDALHVLATEHHALEYSLGVHEHTQGGGHPIGSEVTSDEEEFFDAESSIAFSLQDDLPDEFDDESEEFIATPLSRSVDGEQEEDQTDSTMQASMDDSHESSSSDLNGESMMCCVNVAVMAKNSASKTSYKPSEVEKEKDCDKERERVLETPQEITSKKFKLREKLPVVMMSRSEFSVWTVLRHSIGKDLSRITMPVIFNEPLTFLQRICEYLEYIHLLNKAASFEDPLLRMQYIAAFAISATASNLNRVGKPFNPILGETFELVREDLGIRVVTEQVSHHPPISALHCEGRDFTFHTSVQPKLKFWGKGIEVQPKGSVTLRMTKYNETYTWSNVNICVHNIIVGTLWIEQYGQMEILNHANGIKCILNFKPCGWFGKEAHKVEGAIFNSDKKKKFTLKGEWVDHVNCYPVDKPKGSGVDSASSSESAMTRYSLYDGSESLLATANDTDPYCIWKVTPRPAWSAQMYSMTTFAMQLNELHPGQKELIAPTDSRLRPDSRAMENGDLDLAGDEKLRLEEKQRAARKDRHKKGEDWKPRWFKEEPNSHTGHLDWIYTGDYWKRDYSNCDDLF